MGSQEFQPVEWDGQLEDDLRHILRLAAREDLDRAMDWTTVALIPPELVGEAALVVRQPGVVAGLRAIGVLIQEWNLRVRWQPQVQDGQIVAAGDTLGYLDGKVRDLLTAERTLLNLISRLSGIATWTRRFVEAVAHTAARIYDTRKTVPGWRRLEKYAVRCGGGHNHRTGLFDAFLIKDNHLAFSGHQDHPQSALHVVRQFVAANVEAFPGLDRLPVEIEVDTLNQLAQVLPEGPDLVLLDNMPPAHLAKAVAMRDRQSPHTLLEASGGISLDNVAQVAATGVDRISVGAITHQAVSLDVALDWIRR